MTKTDLIKDTPDIVLLMTFSMIPSNHLCYMHITVRVNWAITTFCKLLNFVGNRHMSICYKFSLSWSWGYMEIKMVLIYLLKPQYEIKIYNWCWPFLFLDQPSWPTCTELYSIYMYDWNVMINLRLLQLTHTQHLKEIKIHILKVGSQFTNWGQPYIFRSTFLTYRK